MAIERGVDDVDIDELDIEDNSKEILVSAAPEEGGMFDEVEEGDEVLLDDGTMVFGMDEMAGDMPVNFNANLAEFIDEDELVEVTPDSIRLRKKLLLEHERKRASRKAA